MKQYCACIVGLTGIGSGHSLTDGEDGYGIIVPHSHAACRYLSAGDGNRRGLRFTSGSVGPVQRDLVGIATYIGHYADYQQMISDLQPDILSVMTSDNVMLT